MTRIDKQKIGFQKNKLLRYQKVIDFYQKVKAEHKYITITDLHRDFIYPEFCISRVNLYTILSTPVQKELKKIKEIEDSQLDLFVS